MDGYRDQTEEEHIRKFKDYHRLPVFIFDPEDLSNRLGDFTHEQQIVGLWEACPIEIRRLFTQTLCQANAERLKTGDNPQPGVWIDCFRQLNWL